MSEGKRERYSCLNCPGFYKNDVTRKNPCAGGTTVTEIDGKYVWIWQPKPDVKGRMKSYDFYCLAYDKGKKIGHPASWTGLMPKWCPRLNKTLAVTDRKECLV